MVGLMGKMFHNSSIGNSAEDLMGLLPFDFIDASGHNVEFNTNGDVADSTVDLVNWYEEKGSWAIIASFSYQTVNTLGFGLTGIPLRLATGDSSYTKDRSHVYVSGDPLPSSYDGKFVVLSFVISVLGGWTALILLEQALSFWSRGVWLQATGWVALAAVSFGSCSVWPNTLMLLSSLTLDVDAKLRIEHEHWTIAVEALYPFCATLLAFMVCMHGVEGGFKAAANVNIDRVSDLSRTSETGSRSGSGSAVSGVSGHGGKNQNQLISRSQFKAARTKVRRQYERLREMVSGIARQSGIQLVLASGILAALFITHVLIAREGFHLKATVTITSGAMAGAFFFSMAFNLIALFMYFRKRRADSRDAEMQICMHARLLL
jgi:hypothetical protein